MQGTHSLQLHNDLESLMLMTDRGLRIDAQNSDRLLSFLAQKKHLREVTVGSGYYRLQSFQGSAQELLLSADLTCCALSRVTAGSKTLQDIV